MISALEKANVKATLLLQGDLTIIAEDIIDHLHDQLVECFDGWISGGTTTTPCRFPRNPMAVYAEFAPERVKDLEVLLAAPQFNVAGKWYCFSKPRDERYDLWGATIEELEDYIRFRVETEEKANRCREQGRTESCIEHHDRSFSHKEDVEVPELLDEKEWGKVVLMVMRGLIVKDSMLIPCWPN
jgi:hypothetical protein